MATEMNIALYLRGGFPWLRRTKTMECTEDEDKIECSQDLRKSQLFMENRNQTVLVLNAQNRDN